MHRVVFNLPLAGEWLGGGIRMKWHKQEHSSVSNSFSLSVSLTLSPPFLSSFLALPIASQSLFSHSHSSSVFLLSLQRLDSVPVLQALTQPVVFLNSAVLPRNKRKDSLTSEHCSTSPSFIFYDRCFHLACFFCFFYVISAFIWSFSGPQLWEEENSVSFCRRSRGNLTAYLIEVRNAQK